jgi:methoxymalonate biosynthesis acyl carrier protein
MEDTRNTIRHLLQEILQKNNDTRAFTDTESLIFSGRFQSVDVLEIVSFLEESFGLDFSDEFDQSRLDSVEEIMNLVRTAQA